MTNASYMHIISMEVKTVLKTIKERASDYNANSFLNELFEASKLLGMLEAKIDGYQFNSILIPMFRNKEVISSMLIEGTQTTITDVFEDNLTTSRNENDKVMKEYRNHTRALLHGTEYLRSSGFTDELMHTLHRLMLEGILPPSKANCIGHYKQCDNYIVNSVGTVVFTPPSHLETGRYMRELLAYMNDANDGISPLIKAAIIHSQFESIHPFEDGNGRVGRLLVSFYLYKAKVINFPFFYISESIAQDKAVYYRMLSDSRINSYDEWIRYFIRKCTMQAKSLIGYIDGLNSLYQRTKDVVQESVNSPRFDKIIECIFTQPIITVAYLAEQLSVTPGQAKRYLDKLEEMHVLLGDDRKRGRKYYFADLLDLSRRS